MILYEFKKIINNSKYCLKNSKDFVPIYKYFRDLTKVEKNKITKIAIEYWNKNNIKMKNINDFEILAYYLNVNFDDIIFENDDTIKKICIAGKYEFTYKEYSKKNIRQENIFKLNFYNIIQKLKIYFPDSKLKINFEKPTFVDKELKILSATYKHDIIINISKKHQENEDNDNNIFEIVLEYFEKTHNRFNDEDKRISTNLFSDEYFVFNINEDNMNEFIENVIYEIIKNICAVNNDKYELSKILYFNKNYKIKKDVMIFNKIVNYKKFGKFNFEDFYNEINPLSVETGDDYSQDDFIELLDEKYKINIKIDDDGNCNSNVFDEILIHSERSIIESNNLYRYKNIYLMAINTITLASDEIIKLMKKQRDKRLQLPEFIRNFQKFHIKNLK